MMAQAEAKAIRGSAQPSAAMREVEAIEAKLRAGKPVPTTIPEERALLALENLHGRLGVER